MCLGCEENMKGNNFGMALAGGGARGAYSAGLLRYLYTELPKHLGYVPWPDLVSGTSVGALNGYFAASQSMMEIHRCYEMWSNFKVEDIYTFPFDGVLHILRDIRATSNRASLLDPTPLAQLIEREASRRTLRYSIGERKCRAFIVSATQLHDGKNVLFIDSEDPSYNIPPPPMGEIIRHKLYPYHLMASCAIPLMFPPVDINGALYVDGGLRQNAPLHPLMHGDVGKILVLGTRVMKPLPKNTTEASLSLIAGKALNALTLDPVERDNLVANKINQIIDWGVEQYGEEFATRIQKDMGLQKIQILHLRPSLDLGKLAASSYDASKIECSRTMKWFLDKLHAQSIESGESDLLSHLLFDRCYTATAEDLGFQDAKNNESQLLEFFGEKPTVSV